MHFLLLSLGIRILSDEENFRRNNNLAHGMITRFVQDFKTNFASYLLTFNMHSLIHLAQEVLTQNLPLDQFSVWKFESANAKLKHYAKRPNGQVEQIYNRVMEKYACSSKGESFSEPKLSKRIKIDGDMAALHYVHYERIEFKKFQLDVTLANKWFCTKAGDIMEFKRAVEVNDDDSGKSITLVGNILTHKHDFFELPVKSSILSIFEVSDFASVEKEIAIDSVKFKFFMILQNGRKVFIPLL